MKLNLVNSIFSYITKKKIRQIELFIKHPIEVQDKQLFNLLSLAKNTEIGNQYQFNSIINYKEFKQRIPVKTYEEIEPSIKRIINGERNILWPTKIKWFAKSSGTTSSKSKFIPVSNESLQECHFKCGRYMLAIYCNNNPGSKIFQGKSLALGGSKNLNNFSENTYCGDLSAILIENLPLWAKIIRTPNKTTALLEEWEKKLHKIQKESINKNITSITGVPSWILVLLNKIIIKEDKSVLDIWPNLEVFFHGGISFTPYRKEFSQLIKSPQMNYIETYNASEGFFAIQDQNNSSDLLLILDSGVFYEFISMKDYNLGNLNAIPLSEVEKDVNYCLIITTNSGLWRYLIGDTILFTSTNPYRIRITGRTKNFINSFGEELIIENANFALNVACDKTYSSIKDYTVAPVYISNKNKSGCHEWLIEFNTKPKNLQKFTYILDHELKKLNSDYEAKRYKNLILSPPIINYARTNLFYDWLNKNNKLGGQNKIPRLSNNREFLNKLLDL